MQVFILVIFLACAWGQYDTNLCDLTRDCSGGEICSDMSVSFNFPYPSDRSGYTCSTDTKKCVAPQCSHYYGLYIDALAPQCGNSECIQDTYVCDAPPEVIPEPEPLMPKPRISLVGFFQSAGNTGDYCTSSYDCTGYCDYTTKTCKAKKAFSPSCAPVSCASSEECFEGTCDTSIGKCARTNYRRTIGNTCLSNMDCLSNDCEAGKCSGTDCTNYVCPTGLYCDYETSSSGVSVNCFPDYNDFISKCDLSKNFAKRVSNISVECTPKGKEGDTCDYNIDNECTSGWCNSGKCTGYSKDAIPLGKSCSSGYTCDTGLMCSNGICVNGDVGSPCLSKSDCDSGLICNSSALCAEVAKEGDDCATKLDCDTGLICNSTTQCAPPLAEGEICGSYVDCNTGLHCSSNDTDTICTSSSTLGKPCAWDSEGYNNCSTEFAEVCVCYGGGPTCVSVDSSDYQAKLKSYEPIQVVPEPGTASASISVNQLCYAYVYPDLITVETLSSVLQGPYLKSQSFCNIASPAAYNDPDCLSTLAKFFCCSFCSTLTDSINAVLKSYPNIDKDAPIFYSPEMGPILSVTCGGEPKAVLNVDSCDGPKLYSINDLTKMSCDGATQPSYGKVTVTIAIPAGTDPDDAGDEIEQIINDLLASKGYETPTYYIVETNPDNTVDVTLFFVGDKNDQSNLDTAQNVLKSSEFSDKVSQAVPGAAVSNVKTETSGSGAQSLVFSMITFISFALIGLLF